MSAGGSGSDGGGNIRTRPALALVAAVLKDAGYLHIPEGRRDHTTPAETLCLHGLE